MKDSDPHGLHDSRSAEIRSIFPFISYIRSLRAETQHDILLCSPTRLLVVTKDEDLISRKYFRLAEGSEEQFRFEVACEANFYQSNGSFKIMDITIFDSSNNGRFTVSFLEKNYFSEWQEVIGFVIKQDNFSLRAYYNPNGKLVYIDRKIGDQVQYLFDWDRTGSWSIFGEGGSECDSWSHVLKLVLTKKEAGEINEVIEMPSEIDREVIISQLFPVALLANPIKAIPEDDESWKQVSLPDTFAIKWERS